MNKIASFFTAQKHLWQLQQEVGKLRKENSKLRAQNDSMRAGMRRCVTCEYRIDFKDRQGKAPILDRPAGVPDKDA